MPIEEEGLKESEFNSAIATLMRLDTIKKFMGAATAEEKVEDLFKYLRAFWKELDSVMNNTERKEQEETFAQLEEYRKQYFLKEITGNDFFRKLDRWEIELRRIEQLHKMNMPMGRDKRWVV